VAYTLSIRKEAEADIAEAYQYYKMCREDLGDDFVACIEESFSRIKNNPRQYKTIHKNVHRALVRKFPYGIFYVLKDENVLIIGVLHARKNPRHWQSRS